MKRPVYPVQSRKKLIEDMEAAKAEFFAKGGKVEIVPPCREVSKEIVDMLKKRLRSIQQHRHPDRCQKPKEKVPNISDPLK